VYFCCLEALQNAAKHAGAGARARLTLREDGERLVFRVEDDGVGFDRQARASGLGFTSMGDRLGAVGGRLEVESATGSGTTVEGSVPVSHLPRRDRSTPPSRDG
jgi:signal transduction histidine kinase